VKNALAISQLSVGYGHVGVLEDVNLSVRQGTITALLGSNGAGKTTLLKAISGLLKPTRGTIVFDGADIAGAHPNRIVLAGVLQVPEGRGLFRLQSVRANLDLGLYGCGLSKRQERDRLDQVLSLFPILAERIASVAGVLSGGQQQMLAIGQALMRSPKLLMLDEPSLGLAPLIVTQVMDTLQRLRREGTTILLVEQMVERALEIADYAYVLQSGRVMGHGTPSELASGELIRTAYLGPAHASVHAITASNARQPANSGGEG
jgi:branched-chain amino acid transport system ATP-binding protein